MSTALQLTWMWLADYALMAIALFAIVLLASLLIREPVKRIAMAWLAMAGLLVLAGASAMPFWPRLALIKPAAPLAIVQTPPAQPFPTQSPPARPVAPVPPRPMIAFAQPRLASAPQRSSGHWTAKIDPPTLVAAIYLMGAVAMFAWLLAGAIYSRRLHAGAIAAPDWAQESLRSIASNSVGFPRLLTSSRIPVASACV